MAPTVDCNVNVPSCKRCKSKVLNGLKCQNCSNYFHQSCAKLYNNVKISEDKTFIVCCESENGTSVDSDAAFYDAIENLDNCDKKVDGILLSYILKQKDIIIHELREKISLLNKQIELMNAKSETKTETKQKHDKINTSAKSVVNKVLIPNAAKTSNIPKTINNDKNSGDSLLIGKQITADLLDIQTQLKCNEIINLVKDTQEQPGPSHPKQNQGRNVDTEWQKVQYKRRRNMIVGKNKDIAVKGVPKIALLHVYRVDLGTTTAELRELLKGTFPEVICESLTPKHPELYASFKVSIYEENFSKAMNPDVWPDGACVSRFFQLRRSMITNP